MISIPSMTIAVRFLGLVILVVCTPRVFELLHRVVQEFMMGGWQQAASYISPFVDYGDRDAGHQVGWIILLAVGLYMFLSGRWVIVRLTRGIAWPGGRTCHKCGYDVSAVPGDRCPECGTKLNRS